MKSRPSIELHDPELAAERQKRWDEATAYDAADIVEDSHPDADAETKTALMRDHWMGMRLEHAIQDLQEKYPGIKDEDLRKQLAEERKRLESVWPKKSPPRQGSPLPK